MKNTIAALTIITLALGGTTCAAQVNTNSHPKRLYWFIPDGMRADPDLFNIYKWAEAGKLPNIKRLMERGTYGFAKPVFPSHTPANFASRFTGAYPEVHGINDGQMHTVDNTIGQA